MSLVHLRSRAVAVLVPVLLGTVAVAQLLTATFGTLSPWKGGGFGMFAAMDNPGTRFISIVAIGDDGEEFRVSLGSGRSGVPNALTSAFLTKVKTMPRPEDMATLARAVHSAHLVLADQPSTVPRRLALSRFGYALDLGRQPQRVLQLLGPTRTASSTPAIRSVRVEILRVRFDRNRHVATFETFVPPVLVGDSSDGDGR
jgi:hypothetical protein